MRTVVLEFSDGGGFSGGVTKKDRESPVCLGFPGSPPDKGKVANLAYDTYWANRSEKEPTPSPGNPYLDGGGESLESLIKSVERGLLVTHFRYIRFVNRQTLRYTGLTRDGLFLIEDGEVTTPVKIRSGCCRTR